MKYARLGDTGLVVSKLGFGAMTFGSGEGKLAEAVYKVDQAGADALVAQAMDAGVNHFNTADIYAGGQSEAMLGKALGARRGEVVISTKVGMRTGPALGASGLSRRHILWSAEQSLRRLGTDWIDVYLCHRPDPHTPVEETVEALDQLVRQGKVRYVGYSNWPAWMAATAVGVQRARGLAPFRAAEMMYSLIGRDLEHEHVPFADHAGVGHIVWSPLGGGFLSGKYTREDPTGAGGRLTGFDLMPFDRDKGYAIVDALKRIAEARGAKPAQVALAWLLAKPTVASVLVGATGAAQLSDNLAAAAVTLSSEEVAELDRLSDPGAPYPVWFGRTVTDDQMRDALA